MTSGAGSRERLGTIPFSEAFRDVSAGSKKTMQSDYLKVGSIPIIDQGSQTIAGYSNDEHMTSPVKLPVVLFGDHTRRFKFVDHPFAVGADGLKILKASSEIDTRYGFHFLISVEIPNNGYSRHYKLLKEIRVPAPPLPEQRRIAAILDQADELRTKRRLALELLDELADSLFIDMFGDPTVEKNRHPWMRVDEVATTRLGKMLDAKQQTGRHLRPYLRNANVHWMRFELDSMEEMDFPPDKRHEYRLRPGDILMCEGGQPGRSAIWAGEIAECYFQKALHRIRTHEALMLPEVFVWTMKFMSDGGALDDYVTSATIAHLTGEKLKSLELPVPSMALQQDFVRKTLAVQEEQMAMRASLLAADELFESLQYRAFRGEL
jgi:type I restriction enzyme S subunit